MYREREGKKAKRKENDVVGTRQTAKGKQCCTLGTSVRASGRRADRADRAVWEYK